MKKHLKQRYATGDLLAEGGHGRVYHGIDTHSGQPVVIKQLKPELQERNQLVARFLRESNMLSQLNHPNIVQLVDAFEENGRYAIVMEFVPGGSLRDLLDKQGQLTQNQSINIALELADALSRAHHLNILHRDLKPGNVLLAADGTPRLTDFGMARLTQEDVKLTASGFVLGSPAYISPEALRGEALDGRSDIWSFGVMLYEMLTGKRPFPAETITALIAQVLHEPIPNIAQLRPDISPELATLLSQMLSKEAAKRPPNMRQIAASLQLIREKMDQAKVVHSAEKAPDAQTLRLRLLDTFELLLNGQPITHFRSANNQGLLIYLALQKDKPTLRETLTTLFWPDESDKNGRNNLRQSLFHLRKLLGDTDNPEPSFLLVTRQTVQLNPESDFSLDVQQFLQAIERNELETAVSLYHGDLLPGFTCDSLEFENWLRQEREQLHNLALEAMSEWTRDCLANGRFAQAQATAQKQLRLEPWREPAQRQLMQAYALSGERGKALQQFERCEAVLQEELGIDPAEPTRKLYEDIKAGRLAPVASAEPMRPPIKRTHNLPVEPTPIIGRELEIRQLKRRITEKQQRLVTIVAPGGMGKTRLGLAVGRALLDAFQDGVYFVDLAPLAQAGAIPQAIATAFDYQAPDQSQPLFPQLLKMLRNQNLLLILDNFEHLSEGIHFIADILQTCSHISLLVTSRQRLKLASEHRFELGGLQVPEGLTPEDAMDYTAVQMFVENGRRTHPNFALNDDNLTDVVRICQLVQGMPLGLLLAATWLELLRPAEIVLEMEKGFDFLEADLADLPPRQRSMQAVFDYSWRQMTPAEQTVLAKLSVFRGGFTREAAEQVADANLRLLLALVNKSLLQRDEGNGRFTIHELLRQFAATQRQQLDPSNKTRFVHCRYFAEISKRGVQQTFYSFRQTHAADRANFWRAWDWALLHGLGQEISDLIQTIEMFLILQGVLQSHYATESIQTLKKHGYQDNDKVMLHLKLVAEATRISVDDPADIQKSLERLIPIFQKEKHLDLLYWLYERLAENLRYSPHPNKHTLAKDWLQKARAVALDLENEPLRKTAEIAIYWYRMLDPDLSTQYDESLEPKLEALNHYFSSQFPFSKPHFVILDVLSLYLLGRKLFEQALQSANQSLAIAIDWQDLGWISTASERLVEIYKAMNLSENVRQLQLNTLDWHISIGQTWQTLGFIWGNASSGAELLDSEETAVSLLSFVYHHPETPVNYQRQIEAKRQKFIDGLEAVTYAAAWDKGKRLDFETAVAILRSAFLEG